MTATTPKPPVLWVVEMWCARSWQPSNAPVSLSRAAGREEARRLRMTYSGERWRLARYVRAGR